jgi:ketosteroid isomerase-like protein
MSEDNVETVRSMLAAWSEGRFDEALEYFDPELVWEQTVQPEGWVTHGTDEMQQALRTWLGTWTDYAATFQEYVDAGERVVVVGTERGTAKGSGIEVERKTITVYTLRSGKIAHAKSYETRDEALEAVGRS